MLFCCSRIAFFIIIMLKTVVLRNIFVKALIFFFQDLILNK